MPVLASSTDLFFVSKNTWWMATSLPFQSISSDILGSIIADNGWLWGGDQAFVTHQYQRPAL